MPWDKINGEIIAAPLTQFEVAAFKLDKAVLLRLEAPTADGVSMGFQVAMDPAYAERLARDLLKAVKACKG